MTDSPSPALTLRQVLDNSAALHPGRPALSDIDAEPLTYAELREAARALAEWLIEQGIGAGDTVAILGENCPHWGIIYFAVTGMGAVAVPILTEFHTDAVAHIIRHSEAKAVFVSEKLYPKVSDTAFSPPPLLISMETFTPIDAGTPGDVLRNLKSAGLREFRRWKEKAMRLADPGRAEPSENDPAVIIYTSGTSGHSKGVVLSHKNIVANAAAVRSIVQLNAEDRMLSILPLAHTFECTLGLVLPIMHGACVYYLDKPPTARALLPALAEVKPTGMLAVPLVMEKIYKANVLPKLTGNALSRFFYKVPFFRRVMNRAAGGKLRESFGGHLRIIAIGGAPLAHDAEDFLREARFPFAIGYGLTETSPLLTGTGPEHTRRHSAGKALPGIRVRIANPNPATGEGEIEADGPSIMRGYHRQPEVTAEVFTEDGWLKTGDLGTIDEDGYVYIKGRSKNMILGPSGENIYPEELESLFFASPYVLEVLVYENAGKVCAKVHLDAARLDEEFSELGDVEAQEKRAELLETMRREVNSKASSFARIARISEQAEPFEKTPTHKIKRYLYINS